MRKVEAFLHNCGAAIADWPSTQYDPFFNINYPEDLLVAERILRARQDAGL
jgi:molybdopterin-guanine dinucleotide biosynthesis protein A